MTRLHAICHTPTLTEPEGRKWQGEPPAEWSEPALGEVEHGLLAVPPPDDELQPAGEEPQ